MKRLHGDVIKKLRENRGLSQAQLAEGLTTQSALSKFENNGEDISANLLLAYLKKLDIHLSEYFSFIESDDVTEKYKIQRLSGSNPRNIAEMQRIVDLNKAHYQKTGDTSAWRLAIVAQAVYYYVNNLDLSEIADEISSLKAYLGSLGRWYLSDIALFASVMFAFDQEFIWLTKNQIIHALAVTPFSRAQRYELQYAYGNNATRLSIERGNLVDARFFLEFLENIRTNEVKSLPAAIAARGYALLIQLLERPQVTDAVKPLQRVIETYREFGFQDEYDDWIGFINKVAPFVNFNDNADTSLE